MEKVDVTKLSSEEKLAYLYGVSITEEFYLKFLDEMIGDIVTADPEQLTEIVNNLRTAWHQNNQVNSGNAEKSN